MSGSFGGFSEEEINNLNNKSRGKVQKQESGLKKTSLNNNPMKKHLAPVNLRTIKELTEVFHIEPIPDAAKLCQTPKAEPATVTKMDDIVVLNSEELITEHQANDGKEERKIVDRPTKDICSEKEKPISNNFIQLQEKKLDLNEFQERQKVIEEQNKKRKELLAKALAVRTQQTQEEAQKLEMIRNEFKKLDVLLSGDVKILRHQIEIASLDYMEAEKRYYRIEKEFLEAKLALHQKLEKKELLTEHLCAVIEKNEERKAEKLNDLLSKLNLKTDFENSTEASSRLTINTTNPL